jgi:hypothetical protein
MIRATVIQTKKKESEFSGMAKAAASAVAQQLREQKDGDYYLKNLKLLGALQRTNDTAGVGEVATAEAVKPKADPTVAPAGYMAPEAGDWVQDVAKAQGVDMSQPAFIANQPGFKKAQAAVAAEQVTPRLDEEQMQDPREVGEYRRSIGKGAQFKTKAPKLPESPLPAQATIERENISGKGTEPPTHWMTAEEREEFYKSDSLAERMTKDDVVRFRSDSTHQYKGHGSYGELDRMMAQSELRKQTELLRKAGMYTENKEL